MPNTVSSHLPDDVKNRFDEFVETTGRRKGEIIREAILEYMDNRKANLDPFHKNLHKKKQEQQVPSMMYPTPDTEIIH